MRELFYYRILALNRKLKKFSNFISCPPKRILSKGSTNLPSFFFAREISVSSVSPVSCPLIAIYVQDILFLFFLPFGACNVPPTTVLTLLGMRLDYVQILPRMTTCSSEQNIPRRSTVCCATLKTSRTDQCLQGNVLCTVTATIVSVQSASCPRFSICARKITLARTRCFFLRLRIRLMVSYALKLRLLFLLAFYPLLFANRGHSFCIGEGTSVADTRLNGYDVKTLVIRWS